jgi:hypothetical protein
VPKSGNASETPFYGMEFLWGVINNQYSRDGYSSIPLNVIFQEWSGLALFVHKAVE